MWFDFPTRENTKTSFYYTIYSETGLNTHIFWFWETLVWQEWVFLRKRISNYNRKKTFWDNKHKIFSDWSRQRCGTYCQWAKFGTFLKQEAAIHLLLDNQIWGTDHACFPCNREEQNLHKCDYASENRISNWNDISICIIKSSPGQRRPSVYDVLWSH